MVFFLKISFVPLQVIYFQMSSQNDNLASASIYAGRLL